MVALHVLVERQKKRLLSAAEEMGLVRYESLMESLRHLLDDYEFQGSRIRRLPPAKNQQAGPIAQKLHLEPLELKQCRRIAPDRLHDIEGIGQQ